MDRKRGLGLLVAMLFLVPLLPVPAACGDPGGGDAGNTFYTATEITSMGSTQSGSITASSDVDYYMFYVEEGEGINASLWWTSSSQYHFMNIWLYDPDETYVTSSWTYATNDPCYVTAAGEKEGYWRIKIYYGSGEVPDDYSFRIDIHNPPTAPSLYTPTGITEDSMSVSWSQYSGTDFATYKVYKSTYPDSKVLEDVISSKSTTSYLFEELSPSTDYYLRVRVDTTRKAFAFSAQTSGTTLAKYDPGATNIVVVLYAPTEITDESMTLTWNRYSETDFEAYELHQSTSTGFTASASNRVAEVLTKAQTSYTVTGLQPSKAYYWLLRVRNSAGDHFTSEQTSGTTLSSSEMPPPKVTLNAPSDITTSSMRASWSPTSVSDFYKYELHSSTDPISRPEGDTLVASFYVKGTTSYTVSGLTEDTLYYFMVSTYDKYLLHSESDVVSARTVYVNKPPTPVDVEEATTVTNDYAVIEWSGNGDKDFAKYEVHLGTSESFTPSGSTLRATVTNRAITTYTLSDLDEGTDYYVIVRVVDTGDLHTDSNPPVHFRTLDENQPPQTPEVDAATDVTAIEASITWSQNGDTDFEKYELHMSTSGGDFEPSATTKVATYTLQTKTDHHFTGLKPSTTYYVKVRAFDEQGLYTDSSSVSFKTLDPPSITVVLYTPVNITGSSLTVFWTVDNTEDVSRYEVHMSGTPGFAPGSGTLYTTITQKKVRSVDIDGLMPGTHYYFRVRAYDISGSVTDSKQVSAMTSRISSGEGGSAVLYSPVLITKDSVTLEWEEAISLDFSSYEVHRSTTAGFVPGTGTLETTIKDKSVTTTTITGLTPSTDYYFLLRIASDSGTLDSEHVSGTTLPSTVDFPDSVSLEMPDIDEAAGEIELSWTQPSSKDFLKYEVHEGRYGNFSMDRSTLVKTIYNHRTVSVVLPFDGGTHHYKVRVYNTYWLYSDSEELTAHPSRVELLDVYVSTERTILVQWTMNPDLDFARYVLYMSVLEGFDPSDKDMVVEIEEQEVTTYTVEDLKPDKVYHFVLKVVNDVGLEVLSNEIGASTIKKDRSEELYDLAWTGITLAIVGLVIIILCLLVIVVLAVKLGRVRREARMAERPDTVEEDMPPPPPSQPPPPGPPVQEVPHVEAYVPDQRQR